MADEPIRRRLLAVTVIMAAVMLLMAPSCADDYPLIDSLTADEDWVAPGGGIWLECDASALGNGALTYTWSASEGSFTGTGARVQWNAPQEVGMYDITVTVANAEGREVPESITLIVSDGPPPEIQKLVVTATDHEYLKKTSTNGYKVARTYEYYIECIASSADGEIAYEWSCDDGEILENPEDGSTIMWTAPDRSERVTVTVKVLDGAGNWIKRSIAFQVVSCEGCVVW